MFSTKCPSASDVLLISLLLLGFAACSDEPDAQVPDVPDVPDASTPDASAPDANAPDTNAGDADAPDADAPDTDAPDTNTPDTDAPDVEPDTEVEPDADTDADPDPSPACAFFSDDFSSGDTSHEQGGFRWNNRNFDVTSNFGHGDTQALRFTYGPDASGEDSSSELRFELGRQLDEFWLEHWIYYPTGEEAELGSARYVHRDDVSSDNNKYLRVWRVDYGGASPKVGASTRPTGQKTGGDPETHQGNSALHHEFVQDGGLMGGWGS